GGDSHFLANGDGADGGSTPSIGRAQEAAGFTGEFHAGARAKADVANILIEAVLAYLECELDGGHVAGARKCSGNGDDVHAAIAFVVVNDASCEGDLPPLAIDHVVGFGDVRVERGGVRDELEDGSGLVDVADGMVFEQLRRGVPKVVGVE